MGKQKRKTKMLSFTEKDFDIHEFLMELSNASEYVIELVRRDLNNNRTIDERYQKILNGIDEIKLMLKSGDVKIETSNNGVDSELKNKMIQALDVFFADDDEDE